MGTRLPCMISASITASHVAIFEASGLYDEALTFGRVKRCNMRFRHAALALALIGILAVPSFVATANSGNAASWRGNDKAYELNAKANGYFFASAPVEARADGSLATFSLTDLSRGASPTLSADMQGAVTRVLRETRSHYRSELRFAFLYAAGTDHQFFALFLNSDRLHHVLNLCRVQTRLHCQHWCGTVVDFVAHTFSILGYPQATCTDRAPYWQQ